ncbi:MAG: hypothetical protein GY796_32340 [Chloroflexi bacterium]|nr:hypothetical protein [Chloroflexota bacterium]
MSCARSSSQASKAAMATAGLSQLGSKMGYAVGTFLETMTQSADTIGQKAVAPAAVLALKVIEPKGKGKLGVVKRSALKSLATVTKATIKAGLIVSGYGPVIKTATTTIAVTEKVTAVGGSVVGAVSENGEAGTATVEKKGWFGPSRQKVQLWRSWLTPVLNNSNVIGRREVKSSTGVMFKTRGRTWYKGTIKFKVGQGNRTITHLKSLSLPNTSYYFSRPVSNKDAVGIAAGRIKAETVPGYVGRVTKTEALCLAWMQAKKAAILSQLHWGTQKRV